MSKKSVKHKIKTYDSILEVATHHFSKKGYLATSLSDIVESISLTKSSFYHYFPAKKQLGIAVIQRITEECTTRIFNIAKQPEESLENHLDLFTQATVDYFTEKPESMSAVLSCLSSMSETGKEVYQAVEQHFQAWLDAFYRLYHFYCSDAESAQFSKKSLIHIQGIIVTMKLWPQEQTAHFISNSNKKSTYTI